MGLCQRKNRLGYWRKIRGYTQEEIARRLRVSPRTISNWELDIGAPSLEKAEIVARLFRVSVRELFPHVPF